MPRKMQRSKWILLMLDCPSPFDLSRSATLTCPGERCPCSLPTHMAS
ncbi:hypothetical protein GBAR_LOCUS11792 [Geodia barretti]|uniref:Uncharacterized protein n=1 Tax=Geodia barretti TaxID=519541 RepID=A0AA35RXN2_GEOBA|nr:hypothetical protein GBAR_LOCUS11792 [Geodia barretti]